MRKRIQIDEAELQRLKALGYTHRQLAEHFGCSESTISQRLNPKTLEAAKRCHKRWKQRGPLPFVEFVCVYCHKYAWGPERSRFCGRDCANKWNTFGQYAPQFTPRQLREYVAIRGVSRESAKRIGYTLDQLKKAIEDDKPAN
jgi:hypothetical protein